MTNLVSNIYVPNIGPLDAKIVAVGEAPGSEEENNKDDNGNDNPQPFVGRAGEKLMLCLNRNGIPRDSIRLSNLSNFRPVGNKFEILLKTDTLKITLDKLYDELRKIRPNIIIALGAWPMWFLTGKCGKDKGKLKPGSGILERRGSIWPCVINGLEDTKVLCTLHPSFVSRNAEYYPAFDQDIKRAISESGFSELRVLDRRLIINPTIEELESLRDSIRHATFLSLDIETFGDQLACLGVATSSRSAVCIPYTSQYNQDYIRWVLSIDVPKIFHFGTFDSEYIRERLGYEVVNWAHDTFILQRVLWPQLPRNLAYLTSVHTDIPFYKDEGREALSDSKRWGVRTVNLDQLYTYNCKDCVATFEVFEDLHKELCEERPHLNKIYEFDMEGARRDAPSVSRAGMLVDEDRRALLRQALIQQWIKHQRTLNALTLTPLIKKPLYIADTDVLQFCNADSSKQVCALLYDIFGVRERKKRETGNRTADEQAMLSILSEAKKEYDSKVREKAKDKWLRVLIACKSILIIRGIRKKLSSYIDIDLSKDGRVRSLFKLGTETGRWAAEKYVDGTGLNAQTFPRDKVEVAS